MFNAQAFFVMEKEKRKRKKKKKRHVELKEAKVERSRNGGERGWWRKEEGVWRKG